MTSRTCPTCHASLPNDAAFCSHCGAPTTSTGLGDTLIDTPRRPGRASASYELEPHRLQQVLGESFELGRLIGRGGYAEVFAVRDLKLKRELAIKVLRPDLVVTASLLARFRREAEAVAALQHPHIVPVYDVGGADGICYIVMPLIRGESLKVLLAREKRLPIDEVRRILLEATGALAAAHAAGVIHRDIKPENIMLDGGDRHVRLMDFGIAKAVDASEVELTGSGVVLGTPKYMSPEQASGDPSIDHRTDQYSLAVVGYQMASGQLPFEGDTPRAIITKLLLEPPPPLADLVEHLPGPMAYAIHRALEKDPKKRFATIQEFATALKGAAAPHALQSPRSRRRRWLGWVAAAAVLGVFAVGLRFLPRWAAPPSPAPRDSTGASKGSKSSEASARRPRVGESAGRTGATARLDCVSTFQAGNWKAAYPSCLTEANQGGSALVRRYLARIYAEGHHDGTPQEREAIYWFRMAAEGGDTYSQMEMARRYENGIGVPQDATKATQMYLAAAYAGVTEAYAVLGRRFEEGTGTPQSESQAARWYEEAAKAGDGVSRLKIAAMYARGRGVKKDESQAKIWYEKAAVAGNRDAQYELGMIYLKGKGVPKSEVDGVTWLRKAAEGGHAEARKELAARHLS